MHLAPSSGCFDIISLYLEHISLGNKPDIEIIVEIEEGGAVLLLDPQLPLALFLGWVKTGKGLNPF